MIIKLKTEKDKMDLMFNEAEKAILLVDFIIRNKGNTINFVVEKDNLIDLFGEPRPMASWMANHYYVDRTKELIGVEIGCSDGKNAYNMLSLLNIKKIYLVDPYIPYVEHIKLLNKDIKYDYSKNKPILIKNMKKFKDRYELIQKKSDEAIKDIPNNLDFVYIDGDHGYDTVKKDIHMYWKKLKLGGILGGHDFTYSNLDVIYAVLEFLKEKKCKYRLHGKKKQEPDWWIVKE